MPGIDDHGQDALTPGIRPDYCRAILKNQDTRGQIEQEER